MTGRSLLSREPIAFATIQVLLSFKERVMDGAIAQNIDLPMEQIQQFCDRWHITKFALFGSVLRDDFRPDSDVDVLVTFDSMSQRGLSETIQMRDELEALLGRKVDFIVKAAIEYSENWLRRKNILKSARIIYGKRVLYHFYKHHLT